MSQLKPTNRLRWHRERLSSFHNNLADPVLQQWWEEPWDGQEEGYEIQGEWRDVPIEDEK